MKPIFSEWKSATNDLPTKDGDYIVMRVREDGTCYSCSLLWYTVEGGWNTHYNTPNELCADQRIEYAEDERAYWAEVIGVEE